MPLQGDGNPTAVYDGACRCRRIIRCFSVFDFHGDMEGLNIKNTSYGAFALSLVHLHYSIDMVSLQQIEKALLLKGAYTSVPMLPIFLF